MILLYNFVAGLFSFCHQEGGPRAYLSWIHPAQRYLSISIVNTFCAAHKMMFMMSVYQSNSQAKGVSGRKMCVCVYVRVCCRNQ